ncbi:sodium channel modifier 1 [Osmerus eperlanus]|uniref:sodium channel modifier 1 n=1 Tax=Osmerus eperlanus TaxID=29151 RepID=UPI002E166860
MSFKREGNDSSQLNILKKRRVADLLSNFIPEDEAALLKNGRYTCLVCSYRPVFDTVDMLTVHRKGKRHLEGMKWYYGQKKQLQNEIVKRKHQDYVLAEDSRQEPSSSAPLLTQTRKIAHHALLKTAPYNSCHKKTSTKSEKGPANSGSEINISPSSTTSSPQHQTREQPSINAAYSTPTVNQGLCPSERKNESKTSNPTVSHESEHLTAQRRRELEHYLKLKSAGWLQDRSGQWVKDENVEFDSDEEEPAPVPSSPGDSTNNRPEDQH